LKELQNTFQQYLTAADHDKNLLTQFSPAAKGNLAERLNIYYHAYRSRICEALSSQFPNLAKLLGPDDFNQLTYDFIAQYPSTHRNMRWLGDKLSEFLQGYAPNKPLLSDMANFEWRLGLAFDSHDILPLTIKDLSTFTPEQWADFSFEWHPSVYLGKSQTNVIKIWILLEGNGSSNPEIDIEPTTYLVWRKELVSQFKSLSALETDAITYMMQNHTFGELCDYLTAYMDDERVLPYAAGLLSDWLQQDMLIKVDLRFHINDVRK
jgi:hypothetical protein